MVLVSNEWQNKSEDEHKSSSSVVIAPSSATGTLSVPSETIAGATTTTTTAVAITSTISPATATIVNADLSNTCIATATDETIAPAKISRNVRTSPPTIATIATIAPTATIKTTDNTATINAIPSRKGTAVVVANDNNNDEIEFKEDDVLHKKTDKSAKDFVRSNNRQYRQNDNNKEITEANCNLNVQDFIASALKFNNIEIMAENAKETQSKEADADADANEVIIDNTHIEKPIISSSHNNLENDNAIDNKSIAPLLPSVTVQTQNIQNAETSQQQNIPPPPPPQNRQEFIKSRLRTVIDGMKTNTNPTAAAGMEPNFLSRLELRDDGIMQPMFKPLSTFSVAGTALDSTHTKIDGSNNALGDINDTALDPPSTAVPSGENANNGQAKILLICEGNSHPFQARTILLTPNVECMVGRLIAKSKAAENNAIFDCKVLSRKHAVIWYTPDGKFWVKDTKSSNGTFINDIKIGDGEAELHFGDIVKFGVDVVENSRKEVHGCIIACVQLYLPDGREAISIDSPAHRNQYLGEGRISYDDLHRLNSYVVETAEREKNLAAKLYNIQHILETTRKNSSMCWQSMITEDQLLHRIHTLEKKLSFMEKTVPENALRNEVKNLLDDKTFYQQTAKEALRKVYQERCDAMQMLAKMESSYTQSENECSLLRDQITNCKQTLQDVNSRLMQLEGEYSEYRNDMTRQQQEVKEREEQRIAELTEKLRERELECEELKKKISELLRQSEIGESADDDEEQLLEKQAIEKLDAAIADIDMGEDDEDDDDDDLDGDDECVKKRNGNSSAIDSVHDSKTKQTAKEAFEKNSSTSETDSKKHTSSTTKVPSTLTSIFGESINGKEDEGQALTENKNKLSKSKKTKMLATLNPIKNPASQAKRVRESTIMKWLNNSDLKKNEGSLDIFKAICNENEDDEDAAADGGDSSDEDYDKKCEESHREASIEFKHKTNNFSSILKSVEQNLKQLEAEIENRTTTAKADDDKSQCANNEELHQGQNNEADDEKEAKLKKHNSDDVYEFDENNDDGALVEEEDECLTKRNGQNKSSSSENSYKVLSKNNKKYQLLKTSVNMLREAFNEIRDTVKEQSGLSETANELSLPLPQQNARNDSSSTSNALHSPMGTPESYRTLSGEDIVDLDTDYSELDSLSLNSPVNSTHSTIKHHKQTNTKALAKPVSNNMVEDQLREYQEQMSKLNEKLQNTELEAQHTLEIMQVECDNVKEKMLESVQAIEVLKQDKKAMGLVIDELNAALSKGCKEEELIENDLADINVTALEREEELITYKERLEEQQRENIELRNEIALLKLQTAGGGRNGNNTKSNAVLKQFWPYGIILLAIVVYYITTYF